MVFRPDLQTASSLFAQIHGALQTWIDSPVTDQGTLALAAQLQPHLPMLQTILPQQADLLNRLVHGGNLEPSEIVQIATRIAQAGEALGHIDSGDAYQNGGVAERRMRRMVGRHSMHPPASVRLSGSSPTVSGPASVDATSLNLTRITGGLLASLTMLFAEWYEQEERSLAGHGEIKTAGILFTDFKEFSTRTKGVPPDLVRGRLNFYFHFLSLAVAQLGGQVDKYVGDAIMAYVIDHPNNSLRATEIAFTLQQVLNLMNEFLRKRAVESQKMREKLAALGSSFEDLDTETQRSLIDEVDPLIFDMRVGVNTGPVIHGEIGGPGKLELTIIGDAVNTANRMEAAAPPGGVCISEAVQSELGNEFDLKDGKTVNAKGIGDVHVYYVQGRNLDKLDLRLHGKIHASVQGRDEEIGRMEREFLASVQRSEPRFILLEGEAGSGKSTVADAFLKRIQELIPGTIKGLDLIVGRGDLRPEVSPYEILAESLRRRASLRDDLSKGEREIKIRLLASEADAQSDQQRESFAHLLGSFLDDPLDNPPEDLQNSPAEFRERTEEMLKALFSGLSRRRPLLLICDDMQWVDESSLATLHRALSELKGHPITMLGLRRPKGKEKGTSELKNTEIDWLDGSFEAVSIALKGLGPDHLEKIVREVLGADITEERVAAILARASGSAFFAQEMAAAVKSGKSLDQVPSTLQELFQTQLRDLEAIPFSVLKSAAIVGREFNEKDLFGMGIPQPKIFLARLVDGNFIAPKAGVEGVYLFRHDILQEAVIDMMGEDEKGLLHGAYARHLAEEGSADSVLIASHFRESGEVESAAAHYIEAAEVEAKVGQSKTATELFKKAYELANNTQLKLRALFGWHDVVHYEQRYKEELEFLPKFEAMAELLPDTDKENLARIRLHKCHALQFNGKDVEAEGESKMGLALYEEDQVSVVKCRLLNSLGNIYVQQRKDLQTAEGYYSRSLTAAKAMSNKAFEGIALINLSHVYHSQGEHARAVALGAAGIEACEKAGDTKGRMYAIKNTSSALLTLGQYERAAKLLNQGIDLSRKKMSKFLLADFMSLMGKALLYLGQYKSAIEHLEEAIQLHGADARTFSSVISRLYLALAFKENGQVEKAISLATEALHLTDEIQDRKEQLIAVSYMVLSQIYLAQGDINGAYRSSSTALTILDEIGTVQEFDLEIMLTHARSLLAMEAENEQDRAWAVISRAADILQKRAAQIPNGEKEVFLEKVGINREIMDLWQKLRVGTTRALSSSMRKFIGKIDTSVPAMLPEDLRFVDPVDFNRAVQMPGDPTVVGMALKTSVVDAISAVLTRKATIGQKKGVIPKLKAIDISYGPSYFDEHEVLTAEAHFKVGASPLRRLALKYLGGISDEFTIVFKDDVKSKHGITTIEMEPVDLVGRWELEDISSKVLAKLLVGKITMKFARTPKDGTIVSLRIPDKLLTAAPPREFLEALTEGIL